MVLVGTCAPHAFREEVSDVAPETEPRFNSAETSSMNQRKPTVVLLALVAFLAAIFLVQWNSRHGSLARERGDSHATSHSLSEELPLAAGAEGRDLQHAPDPLSAKAKRGAAQPGRPEDLESFWQECGPIDPDH